MAYCSSCGKALEEGSKFCNGCGTTLSGTQPAPAPITRVVVVEPKKGGRLALKGFVLAIVIAVGFAIGSGNAKGLKTLLVGLVVAYGIGAAYIISNLRKWKRHNEVVHGAGIGWTVAVFLLLACLGSMTGLAASGSDSASSASTPTPSSDPKDVLLHDVKLDFTWQKGGFENVMVADFTVENPTQYRFKDFEIKCTHSAPSGTVIDSNTKTVYQTVEPTSSKVVKDMNMGFINSQATRSKCQIIDLVVLQ
jgi:hypothetical protein